jgi:hypothetical protein
VKVRWAIEKGPTDDPGSVYLSLVDREGVSIMGGSVYASEDEAKAMAQRSSEIDDELTWKPAPDAWLPDTYLVSNYYEDEGWNR